MEYRIAATPPGIVIKITAPLFSSVRARLALLPCIYYSQINIARSFRLTCEYFVVSGTYHGEPFSRGGAIGKSIL